ncbi:MAG: isochorismatase family protein [Syntrophales bacterium]|nr:isochorismatase family protein [Syntrophales bacterium]
MANPVSKPISPQAGDVLVVIDVQNCFLPEGSLAVSEGDRIIPPLNHAIEIFEKRNLPIFFSRDWHPPDHCSFREQGGPWPSHGVQDTEGARFSPHLKVPKVATIISKGTETEKEEYSALYGRDAMGNTLYQHLRKFGIRRIFVGGLATDYCVLNTVRDVLKEGYEVYVLTDAIRAVDANKGDGERSLREMAGKGAKTITTEGIGQ